MYMSSLGHAHIFVWSLGRTFLHILPFPAANSVIIVLVNVVKSVWIVGNVSPGARWGGTSPPLETEACKAFSEGHRV